MSFLPLILTLSILTGQLIKLPVFAGSGATFLDAVTAILVLIGLIQIKFRLKTPPLFIKTVFLFMTVAVLSLILSPLKVSPFEAVISFLYLVRFGLYFLLAWIIYSGGLPTVRHQAKKILILSGSGLALLGLGQLIFLPDLRFLSAQGWDPHYFRTASTLLDPNFTGGFLSLTLLLLSWHIFKNGRDKLYLSLFTVVFLALLTTFSRSAYLNFGVAFLAFSILNKSWRLFFMTGVLSIVLLAGYLGYRQAVAVPRNIDRTQSAEYRVNSWQLGWEMFTRAPVLGVGFNSYRFALQNYRLANENFISSRGASSNDSSLLFVAATTGILGFLAYLGFLFGLAIKGDKVLIAGLAGLLVQSFFINTLFYPWFLIWIILVI